MFAGQLRFRSLIFVLLLLVVSVSARSLWAQSGATLQGTITDSTGAIVPHAHVNIVAVQTGQSRAIESNKDGRFTAPNLPIGGYKVVVSAPGFVSQTLSDIQLSIGATRDLEVSMKAGGADTIITVTESTSSISTSDTLQQGLIDGKQTRDLPTNGRDFTGLATLNPGVSQVLSQYAGAATATTKLSRGLGAQLTIGGNRPQQNSYRLDGVNINDYANGGPGSVSGFTLGVDAVQEFSTITADAPAQYGRMSGGVINEVTRAGTNQYHGSIYEFIRNSALDARSYFDPVGGGEPSFRRNQFGATFGGPIYKNKTFAFGNYEGFRQAQGVTLQSTTLSAAGRTSAPVNPAIVPYLALFPLPNGTVTGNTGLFNFQTTQKTNEDFSTFHLDHNFTDNDSLHGTIVYSTASLDSADQTDTLYDEAISRRTTAALEEVHIFSSRLTNSARLGYNRSVAIAPNLKQVINPSVDNPALSFYPNTGRSVGQIIVSSLTSVQGGSGSVGSNAFHYNSYQAYDDATYLYRQHTFQFGISFERDQNNDDGGVLPNGEWSFGSISNFLQNIPQFFEGGVPGTPVVPHDLRQDIAAGYFQDSWKLNNRLNVNLGLRYEMATNTTETAGRLGALPTPTSPAAVQVGEFFNSNPTLKNFEPRIGVAWDVYGNGRTVVTAASGIYDNLPLNYFLQLQIISSAPSYDEGRVTYTGSSGKGLFPVSPFFSTTPKLRAIYTPQNPPRSYVIQSSASLQQQLSNNLIFTLGYIGSHGVHQVFATNDINNVQPQGRTPDGTYYWPGATAVAARGLTTLNPSIGTESDTFFGGSSIYHSLQTSLSYSAPRGITGKIAYTWSHSIDDTSSSVSGASFSNSLAGLFPFDLTLARGDSDFDVRNVFSANGLIPIPATQRGGAYTAILRNWSFNNILSVRSGIPFSPVVGGDPLGLGGSQTFNFPNRNVHSRSCTNGHNVNYLDTSCFSFPGTYPYKIGTITYNGPLLGTSRRNTIDGPGLFFWTTGLMKDQRITERVRAQFQAQAFNVDNHTNFANPASAQTQIYSATGALSGTAGVLTQTSTQGRQLQFALKILF